MDNPLRVLHVVVNMNRGGAETLLMNLYRNIDRSKVQFDFLTCKPGVFDEEIRELGGKIYRIPYISDIGHFRYRKELNKFFEENKDYYIVHSHMDKMSGFVLHAAKKAGIQIRIAHSHNTSSEGGTVARAYKSYAGKYIAASATHLLACSTSAAKWLFSYQASKAMILKNGIECDKLSYSQTTRKQKRKELNLPEESFIVGHVGRFNHQKNHSFLIDIYSEIAKKNPYSDLLLVGEGPLQDEIQRKVSELGLVDKVFFLGVRSDVHQLLQACDVMLFPSLHEGLPVTLVEAQAAGLPCIISDVITTEVDIGAGLIQYENLKSSPEAWAKKVLDNTHERKNTVEYIQKSGFDIRKSSIELQDYYLSFLISNLKETIMRV
ncbi:glycosyltransferase family 1 protein [Niallia oryzisoli]|uniref:Glycosyltransferase family 1 protein n=1 Tax=Niallia oryzisoli TaxID=1737571 RepID=A0ABZ2CF45_9BACI